MELQPFSACMNPWMSDQPVVKPLTTDRTTQTQNKGTHRHPCLEWDSNPQSQRSGERRQVMSWTPRPLWSEPCSCSLSIIPNTLNIVYKLEKHQYLLEFCPALEINYTANKSTRGTKQTWATLSLCFKQRQLTSQSVIWHSWNKALECQVLSSSMDDLISYMRTHGHTG
jgi:hypothetical protein